MASGDDYPKEPAVQPNDDEKSPDTYVRVIVYIDGLNKGMFSRKHRAQPTNGSIEFEVQEKSLTLRASITSNKKTQKWEYSVKQLPEAIMTDPKKTYWEIKRDGEVELLLCKVNPGSWVKYFGAGGSGLEMADT